MHTIPHIKKDEQGITSLYVHGKPFIGLGGEIHNSSSSNLEYMEKQVWPYIKDLHMNLVIAPIFWETIEPAKGEFDFTLLDGLIQQARNANVKLQLLWFGLWKNGESFYTPSWVKEDSTTYFRACYSQGNPSNTVSPLCEAGILADAAAFTKVMEHLKEIDGEENTVIIVQVENEIGFLKSQRDYSSIAQSEYDGEIPQKMKEIYHVSGSWYEAFGEQAP